MQCCKCAWAPGRVGNRRVVQVGATLPFWFHGACCRSSAGLCLHSTPVGQKRRQIRKLGPSNRPRDKLLCMFSPKTHHETGTGMRMLQTYSVLSTTES